jgi:hypothetical protein
MNYCDIKCLAIDINQLINKTEEKRRNGHLKGQASNQ